MQWSGDMNAGFNNKTNITWLPVHPDYKSINVEVQDSSSTVQLWRNVWLELDHFLSHFKSYILLQLFLL